jgi:Zn-dependent peptidase ImmA (M78 family)/DNA-binding XRE family transcriptional regulator
MGLMQRVFTPSRLTVARMRRGLSKFELAAAVSVHPKMVTEYEAGRHAPSLGTLSSIASVLKFPEEFFFGPTLPVIGEDNGSFRSLARIASGHRDAVLAAASIAIFDVNRYIESRFKLPPPSLPDYGGHDPETAAAELRAEWGFGVRSIRSVIHELEAHGVRVYSLSEECAQTVDAFSLWAEGTPFVFLNPRKSGERGRFDAAHELGHLVLHQHGAPRGREAEHEANRFASAFLMPLESVIASTPRLPSIDAIVMMKKSWNVSVGALAHRLADLRLISDWQYKSLCIEIARRGWRVSEPEPIPRETSQVFRKVFAAIRNGGPAARARFAQDLRLTVEELDSFVYGLVPVALDGGGGSSLPPQPGGSLRLVKR